MFFYRFQGVIGNLHHEVVQEYVKRLLRGEVKLKDREHQQMAFDTVMDNAESLHKLFTSMVRCGQHLTHAHPQLRL